jgi:hypothetical protein
MDVYVAAAVPSAMRPRPQPPNMASPTTSCGQLPSQPAGPVADSVHSARGRVPPTPVPINTEVARMASSPRTIPAGRLRRGLRVSSASGATNSMPTKLQYARASAPAMADHSKTPTSPTQFPADHGPVFEKPAHPARPKNHRMASMPTRTAASMIAIVRTCTRLGRTARTVIAMIHGARAPVAPKSAWRPNDPAAISSAPTRPNIR